ncbi:MAG: MFS transporter, partial [Actinomycetota bacterium]
MRRLDRRARWGYGLTGLAQNVMVTCLGVHLFVFYTDVIGLAPLWVSGGLFIATAWDAVSDVVMGRLSDRTRWQAGRRRPYLLLGVVPMAFAFLALLAPPAALTGTALGLYFTGALVLLFTAKTVVQVPALSMLPEMARGYDERTRLSSAREQLGNVGDLLGLLLPLVLLMAFGLDGSEGPEAAPVARDAFGIAGAVIAALSLAAILLAHRSTFEPPPERRSAPPATPLLTSLYTLFSCAPFRQLMSAAALGALGLAFVQSMILYVFNHVLEETDPRVHLGAFVLNAGAAIVSYPAWTRISRRFGKP